MTVKSAAKTPEERLPTILLLNTEGKLNPHYVVNYQHPKDAPVRFLVTPQDQIPEIEAATPSSREAKTKEVPQKKVPESPRERSPSVDKPEVLGFRSPTLSLSNSMAEMPFTPAVDNKDPSLPVANEKMFTTATTTTTTTTTSTAAVTPQATTTEEPTIMNATISLGIQEVIQKNQERLKRLKILADERSQAFGAAGQVYNRY